jgi:hypothetical protein
MLRYGASLLGILLLAASASAQCIIPESQIISGGVGRDGIPALTTPEVVSAQEGDSFLLPPDMILGVVVNGEARAYPHGILWWHEIINDVLGGKPITVSYCPLTGSGLVYDPAINGQQLNFGVSGLLFDNNLVLFDRQTDTLWSQMRVEGICGAQRGTVPKLLPIVQSTWAAWKSLHPNTTVVSFNTGFSRNYNRYPYGDYDQLDNNQLLFPHSFIDPRLPMKEVVLGIKDEGVARAYPMSHLDKIGTRAAVNDNIKGRRVLVVYDRASLMALAYERKLKDPTLPETQEKGGRLLTFDIVEGGAFPFKLKDRETGTLWSLTGAALEGPLAGAQLDPIADSYAAFWFAWASFNQNTQIYSR